MWGGRFATPPSEALAALNNSLSVDRRLWAHDIRGSKAWVSALEDAGVLDPEESAALLEGLDRVHRRLAGGGEAEAHDEDIHTLVERLLYEEVGDVAGKLHTGRSRNDQVATDMRLWCLDAIEALDREVAGLGSALATQARGGVDMLLPGYTHGQQAQPVRWAYVLAAHARPLVRDRERLAEVSRRVSELPLGSGALAGSGVAVNRERLKEALGFRTVSANALDATGDRDFVAELLFAITLLATHVSRLGGELVTYSSTEYGFVRLSDAFSTGSSLLPQKRNPDVFELARAKAARTLGDLVAMLGTMRALPAGYSKDLQEDKAVLFDAVDTMLVTLPAVRGAVETLEPVPERMQSVLRETLLATDVADELVDEGVPFRDAHGMAGRLVQAAETLGVPLRDVPPDRAAGIHGSLPDVLARLGSFEDSVERRRTVGGTSRASVVVQLDDLEQEFGAA
jgi:argininosuccinate lyase